MPYVDIGGSSITNNVVSGGTELFSRLIVENFDVVVVDVPWVTTVNDNKRYVNQIRNLIEEHKIDLILSNNIKAACFYGLRKLNTPIMHITHTNYGLFEVNKTLATMIGLGHSIFAVSQHNKNYFDSRSVRLKQPKLEFSGIVAPAYCQYDAPVNTSPEEKIIAVGRANSYKNPFILHKMVKHTNYVAEVITTTEVNRKSMEYYERNKHLPHLLKLPHSEVIQRIANSTALAVTYIGETFGITALEALSVGTPLIIRTGSSGTHASVEIPTDESHRVLVRNPEETKDAIDKLLKVDRLSIKQMTQEKYSKDKWIASYNNAFDSTIESYKKKVTNKEFFTF